MAPPSRASTSWRLRLFKKAYAPASIHFFEIQNDYRSRAESAKGNRFNEECMMAEPNPVFEKNYEDYLRQLDTTHM
jgi:hypothetical protein